MEIQTDSRGDIDKVRREREISTMWTKFIVSLVFTVPLFYIAMGHMIGLPLPRFIDPEINPLNFALTQLLLTIPTIIAGYKFYTVGFKTMFKGSPNMDSLVAMGTSAAFIYGLMPYGRYTWNTTMPCTCTLKPQGLINLILLGKTWKPLLKDGHPMPLRSYGPCTKDGGGNPGRRRLPYR